MSEIYIRNITNYPLNVNGTNFYGSSVGHQTPAIVNGEFHYRSNANGVYVCWAQGGVRYCAKGIDSGSTIEPANSVWVPSGNLSSLRFSNGSRQFRIDQVGIQNNVSNTTITVFENSNFTGSLGSINAGSTLIFSYRQNYYLRINGLGENPTFVNRTISNSAAGHQYRVDGTYVVGGSAQFSCDCVQQTPVVAINVDCVVLAVSPCATSFFENDGSCAFPNSTCGRDCRFDTLGPDTDVTVTTTTYRCIQTTLSPASNGVFSVAPTVILLP
jgi:hypothetical protein